jgi:hypothetical protein
MKLRSFLLLAGAIVAGLFIAWVDTGPRWDDTAVTLGAVFLVSTFLGAMADSRPWFFGLVFGVTMAMIELGSGSAAGSGATLLLALVSSLLGGFVRKALVRPTPC